VEIFGAQGGENDEGGLGGFVTGTLQVTPGTVLFIAVGGMGGSPEGGWNGGGDGVNNGGGGGGASDIRLSQLISSRLAVAGGGGGGGQGNGGNGGGLFGGSGSTNGQGNFATGGGQTSGGLGGAYNAGTCYPYAEFAEDGTFGEGGDGVGSQCGNFGSGGGGGWYGGGGMQINGAGGGSSYIELLLEGATVPGQKEGSGFIRLIANGN